MPAEHDRQRVSLSQIQHIPFFPSLLKAQRQEHLSTLCVEIVDVCRHAPRVLRQVYIAFSHSSEHSLSMLSTHLQTSQSRYHGSAASGFG